MEQETRKVPSSTFESIPVTSTSSIPGPFGSASTPTLRFPKPQGSQHLANWISDSAPDISLTSMADDTAMGESAYELINSTDGESQDDPMTESISSLAYSRTDDVHSLAGSDAGPHSDTDDEAGPHSSSSSIRYADPELELLSKPPPTSPFRFSALPGHMSSSSQSIEFKEGTVFLGKISVKHTIREFGEAETAVLADNMQIPDPPHRLLATIRQTMSLNCLSTREPLRVMYTGSPAARMDIIYKISSAICASRLDDGSRVTPNEGTEGLFNIFPISEFGSSKTPDVHLLESSGHQIRVEDCSLADEIIIEGSSFPGDTVYSITIDGDKTYKSLFSPSGSMIQPKWATLPHIAIFFCTESDDERMKMTRNYAWEFMNRHSVPCIFISDRQSFSGPPVWHWRNFLSEHAVHLCLESREPAGHGVCLRLPIDLASFLNIDARQMNRNLAYLTGLADTSDLANSAETVTPGSGILAKERFGVPSICSRNFYRTARRAFSDCIQTNSWVGPLLLLIISGFTATILATLSFKESPLPSSRSQLYADPSTLRPAGRSAVTATTTPVTTKTVVVNVTLTRTVDVYNTEASASAIASALSFAGFLSDKAFPHSHETEPKPSTCSAERLGAQEILIRIPTRNRASWLAAGAIDIEVYRGQEPVKVKLWAVDEGILVELNREDSYGTLNVSVITTKRPRINESFEVQFGKPPLAAVLDAGMQTLHGIAKKMITSTDEITGALVSGLSHISKNARHDVSSILDRAKGVGVTVQSCTRKLRDQMAARATFSSVFGSLAQSLGDGPRHLVERLRPSDILNERAQLSILKAQIASKLWWLKMQGKVEEHAKYELRAAELLKSRLDHIVQASTGRSQHQIEKQCYGWRYQRGCGSADRVSSKGSRWRKFVG
ncbi:hypothetical protein VTK73DRAFT_890 [Phialemonium thermophilum]|uniref:Uncharacterized protein n=1 Tax=Phialemonium thermophilum TaxID=223376 RepID=A0ABR3Y4A1_9PEZI